MATLDWESRIKQASADLSAWYRDGKWKDAVSVAFGGDDEVRDAYLAAVNLLNLARAKLSAAGMEYPESKTNDVLAPLVAHAYDTIREPRPLWLVDFVVATGKDVVAGANDVIDAARNPLIGGGVGLLVGVLLVLWLVR